MTREERNTKLKHFITCLKCEVSGKKCNDNRPIQYEAGNMGEIIENLEAISKVLEQEPCGDAVSREFFLRDLLLKAQGEKDVSIKWLEEYINSLPSVTPQPKTGYWIQTNEFFINPDGHFIYKFICSECKSISYFRKSNKKAIGANACSNCGAKMQESEEV